MIASAFTVFHLIPAVDGDTLLAPLRIHTGTYLVFVAWTVCAGLIVLSLVARAGLEKAKARPGLDRYLADDRLTPRTLAEVMGSALLGLFTDILGDADAKKFFPYLAALFFYILAANMAGAIPGLASPTDNINTNFGIALLSFLVFNAVGIGRDVKGYVMHLLGPVATMSPKSDLVPFLIMAPLALLIFPIEVFGLALRPMTLTLRLAANMFGDHQVYLAMAGMVPVGLPAVFIGFGLFVSFIQAFVFTLLTTIYINLAKPHHDHEEGHGHGHDHGHAH